MNKINKETLKSFISWAKENNSTISNNVDFCWDDKSGIKALLNKRIEINEPRDKNQNKNQLFSVPKQLLITYDLAIESFAIDSIDLNSRNGLDQLLKENPNAITQLFLTKLKFGNVTIEKNKINEFDMTKQADLKPYLDILPLNLTQPYFWPSEKLNLLQGTDLLIITKSNLNNWFNEWLNLTKILNIDIDTTNMQMKDDIDKILQYVNSNITNLQEGKLNWNSFMGYLWSVNIFNSRAFPEIIFNEECKYLQQAFLYPVVDLLNHKSGANVKWTYDDCEKNVDFIAKDLNDLKINDEIFNNYGDKSNEELLLSYGFIEENNPFDNARLTLRLNTQLIQEVKQRNILEENDKSIIDEDTLQFILSDKNFLPDTLVKLFAYLNRLTSEDKILLRATFEGLDEIINILQAKVDFFKQNSKINGNDTISKLIKTYSSTQKKIFNQSLEEALKFQKQLLKQTTSKSQSISFKTFFKNDKQFTNSLLFAFGVTKFEDLITKDCVKQVLLLWFVRIANMDSLKKKLDYDVPNFIIATIEDVSSSIVVEKEDVLEFMDFYKNLFPKLSGRIPEVYDVGDWGIKQFIIADNVIDRLVWTRKINQEPIILLEDEFDN